MLDWDDCLREGYEPEGDRFEVVLAADCIYYESQASPAPPPARLEYITIE